MIVRLSKPAQADIEQAARYYDRQKLGLGVRFLESLEKTIDRIAANPEMYARAFKDVRRAGIDKFPYSLFYRLQKDAIVIACLHAQRDPRLARERATES